MHQDEDPFWRMCIKWKSREARRAPESQTTYRPAKWDLGNVKPRIMVSIERHASAAQCQCRQPFVGSFCNHANFLSLHAVTKPQSPGLPIDDEKEHRVAQFREPITDIIRKMLCARRTGLYFSADISAVFSSHSLITYKLIHFSVVQCESPRLTTSETSQQILSILSPSLNLCSGRREKNRRHDVCLACLRLAGRQMRSEMGETNDTLMF